MDPLLVSATGTELDQASLEDWGPRIGADVPEPSTTGRWSGRWEILETVRTFYVASK